MVAGAGRADIQVPGTILDSWLPPNTYVWGESVRNIRLDLDLTPVPGLADIRQQVQDFYSQLAARNRDAYLQETLVNAQIAEQQRIDQVRSSLPTCH